MTTFKLNYRTSSKSDCIFGFDAEGDFGAFEFAKGFIAGVGHALEDAQAPVSGALSADGDPTPIATYSSEASGADQANGWNFRPRPRSARLSGSDLNVDDPHDSEPGELSQGGARSGKLRKRSPAARPE